MASGWKTFNQVIQLNANGQYTVLDADSPQLVVVPIVTNLAGGTTWPNGRSQVARRRLRLLRDHRLRQPLDPGQLARTPTASTSTGHSWAWSTRLAPDRSPVHGIPAPPRPAPCNSPAESRLLPRAVFKPALKRLVDHGGGGAESSHDLTRATGRVMEERRQDMFGADVAVAAAPGVPRLGVGSARPAERSPVAELCPEPVSHRPSVTAWLVLPILRAHGLLGYAEQAGDLLPAPTKLAGAANVQLLLGRIGQGTQGCHAAQANSGVGAGHVGCGFGRLRHTVDLLDVSPSRRVS